MTEVSLEEEMAARITTPSKLVTAALQQFLALRRDAKGLLGRAAQVPQEPVRFADGPLADAKATIREYRTGLGKAAESGLEELRDFVGDSQDYFMLSDYAKIGLSDGELAEKVTTRVLASLSK